MPIFDLESRSANGAHGTELEQQPSANGVVDGPGSRDNVVPELS